MLGDDPTQVERFLREVVAFDDDALILDLLAFICRSNPLLLLQKGYPFHRNYWGELSNDGKLSPPSSAQPQQGGNDSSACGRDHLVQRQTKACALCSAQQKCPGVPKACVPVEIGTGLGL